MPRRAWMLLWLLAFVWGASYMFIEVALRDMHPVFLVWARLALGALVLVPLTMRSGGGLRGLRGLAGPIALLALIQVIGPFLLIAYGQERIASGLTGILIGATPLVTALLGMVGWPGAERVGGWSLAGIMVGLVGVALLFGADLTGSADAALGGTMVLLATVGYAIGAIYLRRRMPGAEPLALAAGSMIASAALLAPAAAFFVPPALPSLEGAASIVVLGVVGTGLAFVVFYRLLALVGAANSALVTYLSPGFALVYGALLLDEPITLGAIAGLSLILAGSWMAAAGRPPWRARVPAAAPATG